MILLEDPICTGQLWQSSEAVCEVISFGSGGWKVRIIDGFGAGQVLTLPADALRRGCWQTWPKELDVWSHRQRIIEPV